MQGCIIIVQQKTIHINKEPKSTFGVCKDSQKYDDKTVETSIIVE